MVAQNNNHKHCHHEPEVSPWEHVQITVHGATDISQVCNALTTELAQRLAECMIEGLVNSNSLHDEDKVGQMYLGIVMQNSIMIQDKLKEALHHALQRARKGDKVTCPHIKEEKKSKKDKGKKKKGKKKKGK